MRKAVIASLVGGLVLVGAFFYLRPACACMTPSQYGRDLMREELDSIARLEQAWRASHHAFTLQLPDLAYRPDSAVRVQLAGDDSVLHLVATYLPRPEVRCSLAVTAAAHPRGQARCSE